MTEINTSAPVSRQQAARQRRDEPTNAQANRLSGLASGLPTEQTIEKIMAVERRRMRPLEDQKLKTQEELKAFKIVGENLQALNATAESLAATALWEAKVIESNNEEIVTASGSGGANPGKHTLIVDRLALNHQIASQGYASADEQVGTGHFKIQIGDSEANSFNVTVDQSANTLEGLKNAINFATDAVNATIIKTGNTKAPYQMVLTSQTTGSNGRILLDIKLEGGAAPNFDNTIEAPSPWAGLPVPEVEQQVLPPLTGTGASTSIINVVGDYTGSEDNQYRFTAVQTGIVGGKNQLQVRWEDDHGRNGVLQLDSLKYAAGEQLPFVDGLQLVFSAGEIVVGDEFSFKARTPRSEMVWWEDPKDRVGGVTQPTAWSRQGTVEFGAPEVDGSAYAGEDDLDYTLTVVGEGQIGRAENLSIQWSSENGESGTLQVGQGYEAGGAMALSNGITVALKPGTLTNGLKVNFTAKPKGSDSAWWLPEAEQGAPATVEGVTEWKLPQEVVDAAKEVFMPTLPEKEGPRLSDTEVVVTGTYNGDEPHVYTFTAVKDGAIGTTKDLRIRWEDELGHTGDVLVGEEYKVGTPVPFDAGLSIAFGPGQVFGQDHFTLRTRTSTIQPPQDALIRFGATELGGGLEITSSTNELTDVIEGVRLVLVSSNEKPVTVSIRGDTGQAVEQVHNFVAQYNALSALITEATKYDPETEYAGPLLGNRDVINIRGQLSEHLIDPVAGLPREANMLLSLGVSFDDKSMLVVDDAKLQGKVEKDFALVADLFRNKGNSNNAQVAFVGMTDDTKINTEGYAVEIESPATQGSYLSQPLVQPIVVDGTNDRFFITADGRQSDQLVLPQRAFTVFEYARALQDVITNDKQIGDHGVRVVVEDNERIKLISGRFGSNSMIGILPIEEGQLLGPGLVSGTFTPGRNVSGTVDGVRAEGNGQLLKVANGSGAASGLRLMAKLSESQLNPAGPEASVTITRGIGSRIGGFLKGLTDPRTGSMRRIMTGLTERVENLDKQLERMEGRIDRKKKGLQEKFARLESQLSTLRNQQKYMASQMGGSPAGLPGMPG